METRASYVLVGGFVLTLVAATFAFVIFLARFNLESGTDTYVVNFTGSVQGLEVGSRVRLRGVPIGNVTSIRIDRRDISKIRVQLDINRGTPIKEDMIASLALEGITGVASVSITGGTQDALPLRKKEGQDYPEIPSRPSTLEKVLEDLPQIFERLGTISERLVAILSEENRASVAETLENVRALTATLAAKSKSIDSTLTDANETAAMMRRTAVTVEKAVDNINRRIDPLGDQAQRGIADLRRASQSFVQVADKLDRMVEENRRPISDFSSTGLYELSQFLVEARTLVSNLNELTQQIQRDPAKFFFGDTKKGYEAK
jgi:phospholipid/cholesterol/gamma-HCH transport system substrate-binding protein